jgi:drug/metabolite transporter (DMT)-like permease
MSDEKRTRRATILLGLVIVLWGVNWPIIKVGIQHMPPLWFAVARVFLAALCFVALLLATGGLRRPARIDLPVVLSVGLLQVAAFLGLTHFALKFVEAGRSAILAYTTPLWVAPLSALYLRESFTRAKLLAVALGMAGVCVLFNPLAVDYGDHRVLLGNGLLLLSAAAWAAAIVHVRGHRWRASALALMPWQMLLGALVLVPVAAVVEPRPKIDWSPEFLVILLYNGPVASAFCYWAFVTVNRSFSATATALGSLCVPVVGVFASALSWASR